MQVQVMNEGVFAGCEGPELCSRSRILVWVHAGAGGVSRTGLRVELYENSLSAPLSSAHRILAVYRVGRCSRRGFDLPILYVLCSCVVRRKYDGPGT